MPRRDWQWRLPCCVGDGATGAPASAAVAAAAVAAIATAAAPVAAAVTTDEARGAADARGGVCPTHASGGLDNCAS